MPSVKFDGVRADKAVIKTQAANDSLTDIPDKIVPFGAVQAANQRDAAYGRESAGLIRELVNILCSGAGRLRGIAR